METETILALELQPAPTIHLIALLNPPDLQQAFTAHPALPDESGSEYAERTA
ncbi:hypothetical protein [Arthrobacter sedimenti]|uniref:Uncharacterized protein n=1 Tax=Arthrobacter sedimenti TaxID=2694931 RepID=A0ABV8WIB1_9MICC